MSKSTERRRSPFTRLRWAYMKVEKLDIPAAGTWSRDCELLSLSDAKGFKLRSRP